MNVFPLIFFTVVFITMAKTNSRHAKRVVSPVKIFRILDDSQLFSDDVSQNREQQPSKVVENPLPIIRHHRFNNLDRIICKHLGCDNATVDERLVKVATKDIPRASTLAPKTKDIPRASTLAPKTKEIPRASTLAPKTLHSSANHSKDDKYNHTFIKGRRKDKTNKYNHRENEKQYNEKVDDRIFRTNEYADFSKSRRQADDKNYQFSMQVCTLSSYRSFIFCTRRQLISVRSWKQWGRRLLMKMELQFLIVRCNNRSYSCGVGEE